MSGEAAVIGTLLDFHDGDKLTPKVRALLEHAPESFDDLRNGAIAVAIRQTLERGKIPGWPTIRDQVNATNPDVDQMYLYSLMGEALPWELAEIEAEKVWENYHVRRLKSIFREAETSLEAAPKHAVGIAATVRQSIEALQTDPDDSISKLLEQRRFNHSITPPALRPIYTLQGHAISTPGNLTSVTSDVKTGKSAVIGSMLASAMLPFDADADLLGFGSSNPKGLALLHFDSEQSPDDSWHHASRVLRRAGIHAPPDWFYSYCLTGLGCKRAWECIQDVMKDAADKHGGIHSILLDGVADLVLDVNDAEASNSFVATLHDLAIRHDCPIIGVIHFNPGGEKTRGHLGSQLERKAETNLRLDKAKDATTIWSNKQRRAPIPKGTGPTFAWSDEAGMHVSIGNRADAAEADERESLTELAQDVFRDRPAMRHSDLVSTLKKVMRVSLATADRRVTRMRQLTVIKKTVAGLYILSTPAA